jgi:hypothetical protein
VVCSYKISFQILLFGLHTDFKSSHFDPALIVGFEILHIVRWWLAIAAFVGLAFLSQPALYACECNANNQSNIVSRNREYKKPILNDIIILSYFAI